MAKSKRTMNPADALRKQQRKRELKKNKEDRKRVRESALAKKDLGKIKQDISRLEHLARLGQLDKAGQSRLDGLKMEAAKIEKAKKVCKKKERDHDTQCAQAAFVARMQEQEKKHENEARKLVYDPKRGAFVPAKKKEKDTKTVSHESEDSNSSTSDESDSDSSMEEEEDVPLPQEEETAKKTELTESDDDYDIPLPPGPPPQRPFDSQLMPIQQQQQQSRLPPPPPPGPPPFRGPFPVYQPRMPPPPPPLMTGLVHPPPHRPTRPSEENRPKAIEVAPTISAEPQLRDLQKELLGFVPAAIRRKQIKKGN
ncbi:hypothetical protein A0J61_11350 [Choanephora cucurbitarum]|uniref:Wbp11/ELF5/Saf1 N-terminal domain-containing protein n=1 Tax=Choanephora cucurbitarum TaxID=101091 RepID=A0A1C7MUQ7_9FUNG|nr:hypothetical protein A0J61_11350 [Choanephora cucurbitarum]